MRSVHTRDCQYCARAGDILPPIMPPIFTVGVLAAEGSHGIVSHSYSCQRWTGHRRRLRLLRREACRWVVARVGVFSSRPGMRTTLCSADAAWAGCGSLTADGCEGRQRSKLWPRPFPTRARARGRGREAQRPRERLSRATSSSLQEKKVRQYLISASARAQREEAGGRKHTRSLGLFCSSRSHHYYCNTATLSQLHRSAPIIMQQ